MKIGLLWQYKDEKTKNVNLSEEIHKAFTYYTTKMGYSPDTCYLKLDSEEVETVLEFDEHKVSISKYEWVLHNCLIIGTDIEREKVEKEIKTNAKI